MPTDTAREGFPAHDPRLMTHLADLHLAPRSRSMPKVDPETGRLVRELDMELALSRAVGDILSQDPLPSAVVIAGDVFDTWRGSIDAMVCAISEFRRLREAGIEIVGIAGNHDTPTRRGVTSMFELLAATFSADAGVTLAYDEVLHHAVGDVEYVLLPHRVCADASFDEGDLVPSLRMPRAVLVVHGVAAGDPALQQMDEVREAPIAPWVMDMPWDYVAFGHFHKPGWIPNYEGKASYCGSLENTVVSGPDVCMERGPVYVDLSDSGRPIRLMHTQPIRAIRELPALDVGGEGQPRTPEEIDEAIERAISDGDTEEAIVRMVVRGISRPTYQSLPRRSFAMVDPSALAIRIDWKFADEIPGGSPSTGDPGGQEDDEGGDAGPGGPALLPLEREAEAMLSRMVGDGCIPESARKAVWERILGYLS